MRLILNKTLILIPGTHVFGLLWQPYLQSVGIPISVFGVLLALSSAIVWLLLNNVKMIERHVGIRTLIFSTGLLSMIAFAIAGLSRSFVSALCFYFVISILMWLRLPVFSHYMNQHINSHHRATVLSGLSMIDSLFDVIIFLIAGFITDINLSYTLLFSAGLMLITLVFFPVKHIHIKVGT